MAICYSSEIKDDNHPGRGTDPEEKNRRLMTDSEENNPRSVTAPGKSDPGKVIIYGTLGPACSDFQILKKMFEEGMDGIRLNLSHTTLEEAADLIETFHMAADACGILPELLIDMQGPELRIGVLEEPVLLTDGDLLSPDRIPFPAAVRQLLTVQSQEILLDDGKILLKTEILSGDPGMDPSPDDSDMEKPCRVSDMESIHGNNPGGVCMLRVIRGGLLESRKSVALPGCHIHTPAMTDADRRNIQMAKKFRVTAVMQPFVRSREDLEEVRSALDEAGCRDIRLYAKIENQEGIDRLEELIPACEEIVIARGDLGNAMNLWELPAAQKRIASACRKAGRDFMVVTQMLDSMIHRPVPTRAEVSDIFNAVLDGAASVMVTGETAAGEYPALVIRYLSGTVWEAEKYRQY